MGGVEDAIRYVICVASGLFVIGHAPPSVTETLSTRESGSASRSSLTPR